MSTLSAVQHRPFSTIIRGLVCGIAGTTAMTGWQDLSARLMDGSGGEGEGGDRHDGGDPWESASAPAQVGRLILRSISGRDVPPERIGLLTNVMHWGYGMTWGVVYAVSTPRHRGGVGRGLAFGTGVWAASYGLLVPLGIYE